MIRSAAATADGADNVNTAERNDGIAAIATILTYLLPSSAARTHGDRIGASCKDNAVRLDKSAPAAAARTVIPAATAAANNEEPHLLLLKKREGVGTNVDEGMDGILVDADKRHFAAFGIV